MHTKLLRTIDYKFAAQLISMETKPPAASQAVLERLLKWQRNNTLSWKILQLTPP